MQAVRESTDPQTALGTILKNAPLDDLLKHPQIAGWLGNMAQRASREQAAQRAIEEAAREKQEAWRRGDYYRLGELESQTQEQIAQQQAQLQASEPFMRSVTEFQMTLPDEVQKEVSGRMYSTTAEYFKALHDLGVKHAVEAEIRKRQGALEKTALNATVGAEPTPEREGGPSPGVREITDAEIERMTLAEYERYFDENGKARNGVRVRLTRGIDVSRR